MKWEIVHPSENMCDSSAEACRSTGCRFQMHIGNLNLALLRSHQISRVSRLSAASTHHGNRCARTAG